MKIVSMGYATVICGAVFFAICVYFDRCRHQDPNFRRKLREKRQKLKKHHLPHYEILPKDIDPRFREAIIINEIQVAEQLMLQERLEEAIIHFAHAISICADPAHLINCLRQTLPAASYDLLIKLLVKMYGERFQVNNCISQALLSSTATSLEE